MLYKKRVITLLFLILALLFLISSVSAADHTVSGSTFEDIKDSIDGSGDNDRILLGNKSYIGSGSSIRIVNKSNIIVQGTSDSQRATLDARHLGRTFIVDPDSTVTFLFIDFQNGDSGTGGGGAIYVANTVYVENCSFKNTWGESGAAIFIRPGVDDCTFINCTFINNQGRYEGEDEHVEGAAIDSHGNRTIIIDCIFKGNSALTTGGAVNLARGTGYQVINCVFEDNYASFGGAIRIYMAEVLIENCTFRNNYANESNGGAIDSRYADLTIKNSNFTGNAAVSNGGAINDLSNSNSAYLNIINCNFINNKANNGGGIYSQNPLNISNSNFNNNRADTGNAGGVYSANAIMIQNSNFISNNGRGLVLSGDGTIISGNNFTGNTEHAIRSNNLQNAIINNNRVINNGGTGLYITGNRNKVYSNVFSGNNVGVNVNGNYTNFTSNVVSNSNGNGVVFTGYGVTFVNNNISNNKGHGLVLNGNNPTIINNNFISNGNYGLYAESLSNGVISNNLFYKNVKTGFYSKGNNNKFSNNNFTGNNIGINVIGNNSDFKDNNVKDNIKEAIIFMGNYAYVGYNNIYGNGRNGIYVKGSSVTIERNNISKNSRKGYSTIYINGNNAKIRDNNIISNYYNGLEISGSSASISGNTFKNNINTQLVVKGSSATVKSNSISGGSNYGIYLIGNKVAIISNTVGSNGADGIYIRGSNSEISKNKINSNKGRGISYIGSNSKIVSNSIANNVKNGIWGNGNKNILDSNKIIKNSPKKSHCAIYFNGNYNTYKSNNISSNDFHGLHAIGNGNKLLNNYLEKNTHIQIFVQGKNNNITGNRAYFGDKTGLYVQGSSNKLSKNTIHKNIEHGIALKGSSNQLTGNFAQYNSKYGIYVNGSKNKIIQNTIRGNIAGIVHKTGSSGLYNYNYIVNNKKYNLYREKGSINANYNWWGENKVAKVKNQKISRYVVAKLVLPKVDYLKLNKTYTITFILKDNKNINLNKTIPSTKAKFAFLRKVGKKWYASSVSPKNQTLVNNKATVKIKTIGYYRVYNFKAVIDNQKLNKVFYPPCDLKVWIVPSPNPVLQGFIVTYNVYIQNKGPGNAYNITLSCKNLNIRYSQYSLDGKNWKDFKGEIKISKISKNTIKRVYISGILPNKLKGKIKIVSTVKSTIYDLNGKNNRNMATLKIIASSGKTSSSKFYNYCGASVLQQLLSSKGIYVDKYTLIKELNPKKGQISMYNMIKIAKKYGIKLYAEKVSINSLKKNDITLLKIDGKNHYVTILSIGKNSVTFNDPDVGPVTISKSDFKKLYTGYVLSTKKKGKLLSTNKQKSTKGGSSNAGAYAGMIVIIAASVVVYARRTTSGKGSNYVTVPTSSTKTENLIRLGVEINKFGHTTLTHKQSYDLLLLENPTRVKTLNTVGDHLVDPSQAGMTMSTVTIRVPNK